MAPEQAEGLPSGADADLYSMALVLYEALTGVNPVGSGTAANRARRLGAHLPPLRRQRRDLPHELGRGIDFALRPRPRERGRISDLRGALVAGRELVADEPGVVSARWGTLTTRLRRRPEPGAVGERETHAPAGQGDTHAPAGQRETHAPAARSERHAPAERSETRVPADKLSRALAALGAAATAAWLSIHVLGDPSIPPARSIHVLSQAPIPPALAALAAAAMVLALPRLGWLALTTIVCGVALAQGHSGFALLTLIVLSLPVLVMVRTPLAWPLAAGAPALGLIGLAGAWPALAARAPTLWRRAAIAAVGWVWLLFAAPVAGRVLYLPLAPGTAAASAWAGSPSATWHQLVLPSLNSGALAPVAVWALGGGALTMARTGTLAGPGLRPRGDLVSALASATAVAVSAAHGSDAVSAAPSAVLGAVAGVVIALAPSWLSARASRLAPGTGSDWPRRTISVAWISPQGVPMSVLRSLESKIAGLVEGTFSRAFKSEVRPVEIARKLAREMEEHKSVSLSRTYVPNEYRVYLSPRDRERFADYEEALASELAGYLLEHARSERLALMSRPVVEFETDDRLRLGEFGIQTRVVTPARARSRPEPVAEESGRTMVYSSAGRVAGPLEERAHVLAQSALLITDGRRMVVGPERGHGRSQPPLRRDARRPERLAHARRDPAARRIVGADRSGFDQRLTAQRAQARRLRGSQARRRDRARHLTAHVRARIGRLTNLCSSPFP